MIMGKKRRKRTGMRRIKCVMLMTRGLVSADLYFLPDASFTPEHIEYASLQVRTPSLFALVSDYSSAA